MTNTEYQQLIESTKERDPQLFSKLVSYFDEKTETFLKNCTAHEDYDLWLDLSPEGKTGLILSCMGLDLSMGFEITEEQEELALGILKIYSEKLLRKFMEEEDREEIVVDPEYQDLLDEALAIIDKE